MDWVKREKRPPMGGVFYTTIYKGHEFKVSEYEGGWYMEMDGEPAGHYWGWSDVLKSASGTVEMLLDPKYGWVSDENG